MRLERPGLLGCVCDSHRYGISLNDLLHFSYTPDLGNHKPH